MSSCFWRLTAQPVTESVLLDGVPSRCLKPGYPLQCPLGSWGTQNTVILRVWPPALPPAPSRVLCLCALAQLHIFSGKPARALRPQTPSFQGTQPSVSRMSCPWTQLSEHLSVERQSPPASESCFLGGPQLPPTPRRTWWGGWGEWRRSSTGTGRVLQPLLLSC